MIPAAGLPQHVSSRESPPGFVAAFAGSDRLLVHAGPELKQWVAMLRQQPPKAPRAREGIPSARVAFSEVMARSSRAMAADTNANEAEAGIILDDAEGVPMVCAIPEAPLAGAILHVHGGGWCIGSARDLSDALAAQARRTGAAIASVEYRLAPEHPHPAALEDCLRAARWWLQKLQQDYGIDPARVVIAGESAGAHLALLALLRLHAQGVRLGGAMLAYGFYDLANTLPGRHIADGANLGIDALACEFYVRMLLGDSHHAEDPAVSPLALADDQLVDLPPVLFSVGTLDPLHADSVKMHQRWRQAGNQSWLAVYEEAPHAFDLFPVPEGRHHRDLKDAFVRHCLAGGSPSPSKNRLAP